MPQEGHDKFVHLPDMGTAPNTPLEELFEENFGIPEDPNDALLTTPRSTYSFGADAFDLGYERSRFDSLSPIDSRYRDPEVLQYLSERSRIAYQAGVEAALARTLAEFGLCSQQVANEIIASCDRVEAEEVYAEEDRTRHDIKALTNVIASRVSDEAKPFVHMFATSFDIISTAEAARFRDFTHDILVPRLDNLNGVIVDLVEEYADVPQVGRTHGQHATPITVGFAMAQYAARLLDATEQIDDRAGRLVGKFSGATGAYNAATLALDDPEAFERAVLDKLDLQPGLVATQIVPADHMARLLSEVGIAGGVMAGLANDVRQLQRTEIGEWREHFDAKNQTGSTAMPHKRNPISFENVVSMNKVLQANVRLAVDNLISEHQRDLTDSASARFYAEPMAIVAEMARRLRGALAKLEVDEEALQSNLTLQGPAIGMEALQTLLRKYGHPAAHDAAREIVAQAEERGTEFWTELYAATRESHSLADYFDRFTEFERRVVFEPAEHYTGLAAAAARQVAQHVRTKRQLRSSSL